jgi:hypothetical protein
MFIIQHLTDCRQYNIPNGFFLLVDFFERKPPVSPRIAVPIIYAMREGDGGAHTGQAFKGEEKRTKRKILNPLQGLRDREIQRNLPAIMASGKIK